MAMSFGDRGIVKKADEFNKSLQKSYDRIAPPLFCPKILPGSEESQLTSLEGVSFVLYSPTRHRRDRLDHNPDDFDRALKRGDSQHLGNLAIKGAPRLPVVKMNWDREYLEDKTKALAWIEERLNTLLNKYGPHYKHGGTVINLTCPPYKGSAPLMRLYLSGSATRATDGKLWGSVRQKVKLFELNADSPGEMKATARFRYRMMVKQLAGDDPGPMSFHFAMPMASGGDPFWKEDKQKGIQFVWYNVWTKRDKPISPYLKRDFHIEFFATKTRMPETYEEFLNQPNAVKEAETFINKQLQKFQKKGWHITNYLMSWQRAKIPGSEEPALQNQFYFFFQIERDKTPTHMRPAGETKSRVPLRQILFAADRQHVKDVFTPGSGGDMLYDPLKRLAAGPNDFYLQFSNWKMGPVTYGISADTIPTHGYRLVHSVIVEEPGVNDKRLSLKDAEWGGSIARGPRGMVDLSRMSSPGWRPNWFEIDAESGRRLMVDKSHLEKVHALSLDESFPILERVQVEQLRPLAELEDLTWSEEKKARMRPLQLREAQDTRQLERDAHFTSGNEHCHEIEAFQGGIALDDLEQLNTPMVTNVCFRGYDLHVLPGQHQGHILTNVHWSNLREYQDLLELDAMEPEF